MNSKDVGNLGEHIAIVELLKLGVEVSRPLGDNSRYDLILDINNNLYTCQIKSTNSATKDLAEFWLSSSQAHRGGSRTSYTVDLFLLVDIQNNKVLCLPNIEDRKSIKIRYTEVVGPNSSRINKAEDFSLIDFIQNQ